MSLELMYPGTLSFRQNGAASKFMTSLLVATILAAGIVLTVLATTAHLSQCAALETSQQALAACIAPL